MTARRCQLCFGKYVTGTSPSAKQLAAPRNPSVGNRPNGRGNQYGDFKDARNCKQQAPRAGSARGCGADCRRGAPDGRMDCPAGKLPVHRGDRDARRDGSAARRTVQGGAELGGGGGGGWDGLGGGPPLAGGSTS